MGLLAELTYRCPLACAYCSNPIEIAAYRDELDTAAWQRVITEAAELGVLQCHLSGGEPLLRRDLADIVADGLGARALHQPRDERPRVLRGRRPPSCTTRGSTTCRSRCRPTSRRCPTGSRARRRSSARSPRRARSRAGLAADAQRGPAPAEHRPGRRGARRRGGPRRRPHRAGQHPVLRVGREEPGRAAAEPRAAGAGRGRPCAPRRSGCAGRMEIIYVVPDYYATLPEALHGRLGRAAARRVTPTGDALPCPPPTTLPLPPANVKDASLRWIWAVLADVLGVPRHRLDAGPVPHLRPPGDRLRRLPLPGVRRSPATPPAPTRSATSRPTTASSRRWWRRRTSTPGSTSRWWRGRTR